LASSTHDDLDIDCAIAYRVAIADDHDDVRLVVKANLLSHGFDVVGEATNGGELVRLVLAELPDAIVTDGDMPDKGGFDATRELRSHGIDAPVVIFSSNGRTQSQLDRAWDCGAQEYVDKSDGAAGLGPLLRTLIEEPPADSDPA
jgi:DNA-binding NarL/FixJ family response regulator